MPSNTKKRSFVDDTLPLELANHAALNPDPLDLSLVDIIRLEGLFVEAKGVSLKLISSKERLDLGVDAKTLRKWWVRRAKAETKRAPKLLRRESAPSPPTSPHLLKSALPSPSFSPTPTAHPIPAESTPLATPEVEVRYPAPILAPEPQHRHLLPRHVDLLPDPSPHPYVYSPDVSNSESEAGPPRPFALVEVKPSVERRSESPVVDGKHWLRMMEKLVEGAVQDEKEGRELSQNELYDYCRLGVNEVEDVLFLSAFQLSIGNWHRLLEKERPELMVYYLPSVESFVFWTHHNNRYYKISLPVSSIRSLHLLRDETSDEACLIFTRDLSSPISFYTSLPGTLAWDETPHDWTMDSQASQRETWTVLVHNATQAIQVVQDVAKLHRGTTQEAGRTDLGRAFLDKIWYGPWTPATTTPYDLVESLGFAPCALTGARPPKEDATSCELDHPRGFDPIRIQRVLSPQSAVVRPSKVELCVKDGIARVVKAKASTPSTPFRDLSEFISLDGGRCSPILTQASSTGWVRADSPGIDDTLSTPYSPSPPSPRRPANSFGLTPSPSLPDLSRSGSESTEAEGSFVDSPFSQSAPMYEDRGSQEIVLERMWEQMREEEECGGAFSSGAKEDHAPPFSFLSFEADVQASFPPPF